MNIPILSAAMDTVTRIAPRPSRSPQQGGGSASSHKNMTVDIQAEEVDPGQGAGEAGMIVDPVTHAPRPEYPKRRWM